MSLFLYRHKIGPLLKVAVLKDQGVKEPRGSKKSLGIKNLDLSNPRILDPLFHYHISAGAKPVIKNFPADDGNKKTDNQDD